MKRITKGIVALGVTAAMAGTAVVGYIARPFHDTYRNSQPSPDYAGGVEKLEPTNTEVFFETRNGRTSFALKGRQESSDFGAAARRARLNTKIHFDSEGEVSFIAEDPCDPNFLRVALNGNRDGGRITFNATDAGKYSAALINSRDPNDITRLRRSISGLYKSE